MVCGCMLPAYIAKWNNPYKNYEIANLAFQTAAAPTSQLHPAPSWCACRLGSVLPDLQQATSPPLKAVAAIAYPKIVLVTCTEPEVSKARPPSRFDEDNGGHDKASKNSRPLKSLLRYTTLKHPNWYQGSLGSNTTARCCILWRQQPQGWQQGPAIPGQHWLPSPDCDIRRTSKNVEKSVTVHTDVKENVSPR